MSLLKAWKSVASIRGGSPDSPPRKDRFSLRPRQLPRRPGTALDVELRDSPDKTWPRAPAPNGSGDGRETTLERSFTLSILEGRKQPPASLRESTGTTSTCVSGGGDGAPGGGAVVAAKTSTPLVPPRSRARSASVGSSRSLSDEGRRRKASLVPQTLGVPELEEPRPDSAGAHPPTYSSAAYPTHDVAYRFAQAGPFGMSLEAEAAGLAHVWRYQVEVGVNVLTLRSWVTTVRRGGEDGLLVAEIESGLSAGSATVTLGDESRSSKEVLSRTLGSRMYYIGDGTAIRWNLGESRWEAYFDSVELATFEPGPSRKMVVQPLGHRFFDHLVVAVLLLMREKDGDGTASRTDIGLLPTSPLG